MSSNLNLATSWKIQPVLDWLFNAGCLENNSTKFVDSLAHELVRQGAPIDRMQLTIRTLNPEIAATSNTWQSNTNKTQYIEALHHIMDTDRFIGSPMQKLYEKGQFIRQRLFNLPADTHLAFTELAETGYTDYVAFPVHSAEGVFGACIFVTTNSSGFSEHDVGCFLKLKTYMMPILEVQAYRHLSKSVLNTYVGKRTSQKVFSGMIKRGDAEIINAALWFSDLRNFTSITETLPAHQVLDMMNEYFEFVSDAVSARGGEILRFIGDAMLIVFPIDDKTSAESACTAAIDSAIDAQSTLASLNHRRKRQGQPQIEFGVGLNMGEVVYGNVGARDRLDFTVMGPAVNRTARLESLTKTLDEKILFSKSFSKLINESSKSLGFHAMKGISEEQEVFALRDA
ncbi:MAG: adenylate cyclase [Gammaproteobacteria bacterium]|jgi:adenylate cyclase